MDHREAVTTGLAERYLLGELTGTEREDFERHFFDCVECAEEVRFGAVFAENAKAVFAGDGPPGEALERPRVESRERPPRLRTAWWRRPWSGVPAFAAVALLAVVSYQYAVQVPALRRELRDALSAQPIASHRLLRGSRGDESVFHVPPGARFFAVDMDPDPAWNGEQYQCSLEDESGATRFSVPVAAPAPGKELEILMPGTLPAGKYAVVVRSSAGAGRPGAELARYVLILNKP